MTKDEKMTRQMLSMIRESVLTKNSKLLTEEETKTDKKDNNDDDKFVVNKNTPQFGDVRTTQEEQIIKTVGERVEFGDDALTYIVSLKDLVLNCKISSLKLVFQFRYNDPSGDGCYIWANELQLTEANNRTIGKIRDAFVNWKKALNENGDLMDKLHKAATRD